MSKARDLANSADVFDTVSTTELGYLDGVSSAIQTQIDGKQAVVSGVDSTEIGYLDGVTSAIQTQIDSKVASNLVDAKGDLLVGSADNTVSRLAVGTNNYVLTADSAEASGIKWAAASGGDTFAAGKNKIINGDFRINQRAFSSTTNDGSYGFDRWQMQTTGGTTYSAQTFTPGTAPVAGYEGINFARMVTASQNATTALAILKQKIEDVRLFANQTATISFWAKAGSGTPKVAIEVQQSFGSGGSSIVYTYAGQATLSTSWTRYSLTVSVPSISGKTIGTSSRLDIAFWTSAGTNYDSRTGSLGAQDTTIDIWGVQLEAGSSATDFQTATGNIAAELNACKRYYERRTATSTQGYAPFAVGYFNFATAANYAYQFGTEKRAQPTITFGPSVGQFMAGYNGNAGVAAVTISAANITKFGCYITLVPSGTPFTPGQATVLQDAGSAASYIEVSSEL